MMEVDEEDALVDSLDVANTTTTEVTTESITTTTEVKLDDDIVVTTTEKEEEKDVTVAEQELPATPSWAKTLSLRNLLDVLKAPFYRKQK
jgi:hypothetical protein